MKIKFLTVLAVASLILMSCGGEEKKKKKPSYKAKAKKEVVKKEAAVKKAATTKTDAIPVDMNNKGIGPVKSVKLGAIDNGMAAEGKELFKNKCSACHKIKKRFIGPGLKGVTKRRSAEWIMNMMMNPEEMIEKDPIGKALIAEYNAPMANQNLTEKEARTILEYFRTKN